ncbi:MAG: type II toxin-antitoxin system RelE/ParE family toxin [Paracoccaceae bacterium]
MREVRVTQRAATDLYAIARHTARAWGDTPMERYMRALDARLRWLAGNPFAGRDRSDVAPGYRSFPEGRHTIFYLVADDHIALIGVPHQAIDPDWQFG